MTHFTPLRLFCISTFPASLSPISFSFPLFFFFLIDSEFNIKDQYSGSVSDACVSGADAVCLLSCGSLVIVSPPSQRSGMESRFEVSSSSRNQVSRAEPPSTYAVKHALNTPIQSVFSSSGADPKVLVCTKDQRIVWLDVYSGKATNSVRVNSNVISVSQANNTTNAVIVMENGHVSVLQPQQDGEQCIVDKVSTFLPVGAKTSVLAYSHPLKRFLYVLGDTLVTYSPFTGRHLLSSVPHHLPEEQIGEVALLYALQCSSVVVVGTSLGAVSAVHWKQRAAQRIVYSAVHHAACAVSAIATSESEKTLATGGSDGSVVFVDFATGSPIGSVRFDDGAAVRDIFFSSEEQCLVATESGQVYSIVLGSENTKVQSTLIGSVIPENATVSHEHVVVCLAPGGKAIYSSSASSKQVVRHSITTTDEGNFQLQKEAVVRAHSMSVTSIVRTNAGRNIITRGRDGAVKVWTLLENGSLDLFSSFTDSHASLEGGQGHLLAASSDCTYLSVASESSVLVWFSNSHSERPLTVEQSMEEELSGQVDFDKKENVPLCHVDKAAPLANRKIGSSQEDEVETSNEIETEIRRVREQLHDMLEHNNAATDLEKMDHSEFCIDTEMQEELSHSTQSRVNMEIAAIEKERLANLKQCDEIRNECVESLSTRQIAIVGLLEKDRKVHNFPLRRETTPSESVLKKVHFLRRMEKREETWMKDVHGLDHGDVSDHESVAEPDVEPFEASSIAEASNRKYLSSITKEGPLAELLYHPMACHTSLKKRTQCLLLMQYVRYVKSQCNAKIEACRNKKLCELDKINEKVSRIISLEEDVWKLSCFEQEWQDKETARKEKLDAKKAEADLLKQMSFIERRMWEKKKAQREAEENRQNEEMSDADRDAQVRDIEKAKEDEREAARVTYMQRVREENVMYSLEAEERTEETDALDKDGSTATLKRNGVASPNGDDFSGEGASEEETAAQRALMDMMGGTLEVDAEKNALEESILREEWMDEIPESEMTDEQKQKYAVVQRKEQYLLNEKTAQLKTTTTELKKLKSEVVDNLKQFDKNLAALMSERINAQNTIYEAELLTLRIVNVLLLEQHNQASIELVESTVETIEQQSVSLVEDLDRLRGKFEKENKVVDELRMEEKAMDKKDNFRRDFVDGGSGLLDILFKLYKSRVKKKGTTSRAKTYVGGVRIISPPAAPAGRIGSKARGRRSPQASEETAEQRIRREVKNNYANLTDADLADYEGIPPAVWSRLMDRRQQRMDLEIESSIQAARVAETHERLTQLEAQISSLKQKASRVGEEKANSLASWKKRAIDSEVLVYIPHGLIEVEEGPIITDSSDAILINRDEVQKWNGYIFKDADNRITTLTDMYRVSRDIDMLAWKAQRAQLDFEDAQAITKQLQLLRVTKSLQNLIKAGGYDSRQAAERDGIEKKIEWLEHLSLNDDEAKKKRLKKVRQTYQKQVRENKRLEHECGILESQLKEKRSICYPDEKKQQFQIQLGSTSSSSPNRRSGSAGEVDVDFSGYEGKHGHALTSRSAVPTLSFDNITEALETWSPRSARIQSERKQRPQLPLSARNSSGRSPKKVSRKVALKSSRRIHRVMQERKLHDIVTAQANDINLLRSERDRLRSRTFPSFPSVASGPSHFEGVKLPPI